MAKIDSSGEIDKETDRLLRNAFALRKFPTPVDDIIEAQKLKTSHPDESPLSPGMIARAPAALQEKLGAIRFKVLAILDRRERVVHVNPENDNLNHERFNKLHEVGHDLCEWQDVSHAIDGRSQLDPSVRDLFEQEANYAGARLLFQGDVFTQVSQSFAIGMANVKLLANQFGSSIHAAFHQYIATHLGMVAGYILPRSPTQNAMTGAICFSVKLALASTRYERTYICQEAFALTLSSTDHPDLKRAWEEVSAGRNIGTGEMQIERRDGTKVTVPFELFTNGYSHFLLVNADRSPVFARNVRLIDSGASVA